MAKEPEPRIDVNLPIRVFGMDAEGRPFSQKAYARNISLHGARVVTKRRWQPNDRVLVNSLRGELRSRARVVYCEALQKNAFAIGLELFSQVGRLRLTLR